MRVEHCMDGKMELEDSAMDELSQCLLAVPDPRSRASEHGLGEILFLALCGVLGGLGSYVGMEDWGKERLEWLRGYFEYKNGVPSHDTIGRVLGMMDAGALERILNTWVMRLLGCNDGGKHIAIDGKTARRSFSDESSAIHVVSAWSSQYGLSLGQVRVNAKENEIVAIPDLLDLIDIKGATVSVDAMGCQHEIADKILQKEGEYLLTLKDNQPSTAEAVKTWFSNPTREAKTYSMDEYTTIDKGHGRVETRRCVVCHDVDWLGEQSPWNGLKSIVMVESTREFINGKKKGDQTFERRYYLSSLRAGAETFNTLVRQHWSIESMHWSLDVSFHEDQSRIRIGNAAENISLLRRAAFAILKNNPMTISIQRKIKKACSSTAFLDQLLTPITIPH